MGKLFRPLCLLALANIVRSSMNYMNPDKYPLGKYIVLDDRKLSHTRVKCTSPKCPWYAYHTTNRHWQNKNFGGKLFGSKPKRPNVDCSVCHKTGKEEWKYTCTDLGDYYALWPSRSIDVERITNSSCFYSCASGYEIPIQRDELVRLLKRPSIVKLPGDTYYSL